MKHKDLLDQLTIIEKAALTCGMGWWQSRPIPRLGIPSLRFADGPHGIRREIGRGGSMKESEKATCFPTAASVGNSWDPELGEKIGQALGREAMAQGIQVLLGPGLNIKRSPLCGRNFEYFSEDPYLSGRMAEAYVKGIRSAGVMPCVKHFAVNSQEDRRMVMDAIVDERTLREIYLTAFEMAVKEGGAECVMTSYNRINGEYANENSHLLLDILRRDWGYEGMVVSDWGASNDHVKAVKCRSSLEMPDPGLDSARQVTEAIDSGRLSRLELDQCVDDLLDVLLNMDGEGREEDLESAEEEHHALARAAASQSAVLLKNEDHILPLAAGMRVAVIGDFAFEPRYQGEGSSRVNPTRAESFLEAARQGEDLEITATAKGYRRNAERDDEMKQAAVEAAKLADVVLYFFGLNEGSETEGADRLHMKLPAVQIELLEAIAAVNPNVVGILSGGSPIEMDWEKNLKAILHGYLTGQAGGGAIYDLVTGAVNPSGKLAETYPYACEDTPAFHYRMGDGMTAEYREGLYVGYRYYETAHVPVRYPFGYGLSYTAFAYSDLKANADGVTFNISNIGKRDGAEIAQLYISLPEAKVFRPEKELKGFAKVFLAAGETKEVRISFDDKTFRYWNTDAGAWAVEGGTYRILIGSSINDIRLEAGLTVAASGAECPYDRKKIPAYYSGDITRVPDGQFETLYGSALPDGSWSRRIKENDPISRFASSNSWLCRLICAHLMRKKERADKRGITDVRLLVTLDLPLRALRKVSDGKINREMVRGMVRIANGRFWSGAGNIIRGYARNRKLNRAYEKSLKKQ